MSNLDRKRSIARFIGWSPVRILIALVVRILVPRQRVGVALVGFDEEGRILMLHHVYHPSVRWGIPGGWLNRGEAPAECALRELEEETGLSAVLGPIVHVSGEKIPAHVGIAYAATIQPGEIRLNSEILAADWFYPDALPEPILPFVRESISAAVSYPAQDISYKRELDE